MSKNKIIPEWYSLGHDINICYGGLFVNPERMEGIQVIDLDSASGVNYCNLILKGNYFISLDYIRKGSKYCGIEGIKVDQIIRSWIIFDRKYAGIHRLFAEVFPPSSKAHNDLLTGFYVCHAYMGFDGQTDNTLIAPKKTRNTNDWDSYTEEQIKPIAEEWQSEYILTTNPEREIKRFLRLEGIRI